MKKILLYGVLIIGICLVVLISAPFFIDLNKYKDSVLAQLKPYTDRIVDFEAIDLTIVSGLGIEISGLQIMDNPDFSPEAFAHVGALDIKIRILPLIKKQIIVKKITINQPSIRIMRNAQGVFNFSDLVKIKKDDPIKSQDTSQAGSASISSKSATNAGWLAAALAHSVFIDQARILYKDDKLIPGAPPITLDALDLKLRDISLAHPISIELAANLLQSGRKNVHLKAEIGPIGEKLKWESTPFQLSFSLDSLAVEKIRGYLPEKLPVSLHSGILNLTLTSQGSLAEKILSNMFIEITDVLWQEKTAQQTSKPSGPFNYTLSQDLSLEYNKKKLSVKSADLTLNDNRLHIQGEVDQFLDAPQWDITLSTQKFTPSVILDIFPKLAGALPEELQMEGPAAFEIQSSGSIAGFHLSMNANMSKMAITYADMFHKPPETRLLFKCSGTMSDGRIDLKEVKLQLHTLVADASGFLKIAGEEPDFSLVIHTPVFALDGWGTILPPLNPYDLKGSISLKTSLKGTPTNALVDFQAVSERLAFRIPPDQSGQNKGSPATGILKDLTVDVTAQTSGGIIASGMLSIKKGLIAALPFEQLRMGFKYHPQNFTIKTLETLLYQGKLHASGYYDLKNQSWAFTPVFEGIALDEILNTMTTYKNIFSGKLAGKIQTDKTLIPGNRQRLSAQGTLQITQGEWKNFNLVGSILESLFGIKGVSPLLSQSRDAIQKHETTRFDLLKTELTMIDKNLRFKKVHLHNIRTSKSTDSDAFINGTINLESNMLDLKGKLILSPRHSKELARKSEALEALIDEESKMVLPFVLKGTLDKPRPRLDSEYVIKAMAQYYTRKGLEKLQKKLGLPKQNQKPLEQLLEDFLGL